MRAIRCTRGGPPVRSARSRVPWAGDSLVRVSDVAFVRSAGFSPYFSARRKIRAKARTTNAEGSRTGNHPRGGCHARGLPRSCRGRRPAGLRGGRCFGGPRVVRRVRAGLGDAFRVDAGLAALVLGLLGGVFGL